jgi:HAD superfamily hydrolase (TIGR01549 family)
VYAPRVRAVWFDVGEVLVDETRIWHRWADRLGVPRHTFSAVFGAVIARGEDHRHVFDYFRPTPDLAVIDAASTDTITDDDLYPDARPCLEALHAAGYYLGIAGNQPARTADLLRALDLPHDALASSSAWGVHKPDPAFFHKLIECSGHAPAEILYVGDRIDNDINPATSAGLRTAFLKRGPWAYLITHPGEADLQLTTLTDLPAYLVS